MVSESSNLFSDGVAYLEWRKVAMSAIGCRLSAENSLPSSTDSVSIDADVSCTSLPGIKASSDGLLFDSSKANEVVIAGDGFADRESPPFALDETFEFVAWGVSVFGERVDGE